MAVYSEVGSLLLTREEVHRIKFLLGYTGRRSKDWDPTMLPAMIERLVQVHRANAERISQQDRIITELHEEADQYRHLDDLKDALFNLLDHRR